MAAAVAVALGDGADSRASLDDDRISGGYSSSPLQERNPSFERKILGAGTSGSQQPSRKSERRNSGRRSRIMGSFYGRLPSFNSKTGDRGAGGPFLVRTSSTKQLFKALFKGREDQHSVEELAKVGGEQETSSRQNNSKILSKEIDRIKLAEAFPSFIIDPEGDFKWYWDATMMLAILYASITIPMKIAFPDAYAFEDATRTTTLDYLVDSCYIVDVIVWFRTAVFDKFGSVQKHPRNIAQYYVKSWWFTFDIVAAIPAPLLAVIFRVAVNEMEAVSLAKTPRLSQIGGVMRVLDRYHLQNVWRLLQYFLIMILLAHWIACGWVCIVRFDGSIHADYHSDGTTNWADDSDLYVMALYKSFLLLVGSDVQPETRIQRVYCSAVLICGACFYATIVGNMALLIANFNMAATRQRQKMEMVSETLRAYQLPRHISQRVQNYYQYTTSHNRDLEGIKLLRELPATMYWDISHHLYHRTLMKVPLFHGCAESFIGELIVRLRPQVALQGEVVVRQGDIGKEMFFISRGSVGVMDSSDNVVAVLSDNSFFGEIALLACVKRTATVRTITVCEMNTLSRSDLVAVLQDFPDEVEKFQIAAAARADTIIKSGGNTADIKALTEFREKANSAKWETVRSKLKTLVKNPSKLKSAIEAAGNRHKTENPLGEISEEKQVDDKSEWKHKAQLERKDSNRRRSIGIVGVLEDESERAKPDPILGTKGGSNTNSFRKRSESNPSEGNDSTENGNHCSNDKMARDSKGLPSRRWSANGMDLVDVGRASSNAGDSMDAVDESSSRSTTPMAEGSDDVIIDSATNKAVARSPRALGSISKTVDCDSGVMMGMNHKMDALQRQVTALQKQMETMQQSLVSISQALVPPSPPRLPHQVESPGSVNSTEQHLRDVGVWTSYASANTPGSVNKPIPL